jgi:prefoldin alpha subunit
MADQKEIQEKIVGYQILEGRLRLMLKRRELLIGKILEIETTLSSMEDVEKNKDSGILLQLGSNVYAPGVLKDTKRIIVEIGANVALEQDMTDAKKILEKRKDLMNNGLQSMDKEITNFTNEMLRLEQEIGLLMEKTKSPEVSAG